jgi:hypothetical protein
MRRSYKLIGLVLLALSAAFLIRFYSRKPSSPPLPELSESDKRILIDTLEIKPVVQDKNSLDMISYLESDASINQDFDGSMKDGFLAISDLCLDEEGSLYIADQKLNKIFICNKNLRYVSSIGQMGQGPGSFLGRLRIHFGHDGKLYVSDDLNRRYSVFSKDGRWISQHPLFSTDVPTVNSKGDIYLLSGGNIKIIDMFRENKLREQLIDMKYHHAFYPDHPSYNTILQKIRTPPNMLEVIKTISTGDNLACVFNYSLVVVILDANNKLRNEFKIDHPRMLADYSERIKKANAMNAWILPFGSAFWDHDDHIYLCYFNETLMIPEIYRYRMNGEFVDTLRLKKGGFRTNRIVTACDARGNFYGINERGDEIVRYKIKRDGGEKMGEKK